jgi:hypothetical protein
MAAATYVKTAFAKMFVMSHIFFPLSASERGRRGERFPGIPEY